VLWGVSSARRLAFALAIAYAADLGLARAQPSPPERAAVPLPSARVAQPTPPVPSGAEPAAAAPRPQPATPVSPPAPPASPLNPTPDEFPQRAAGFASAELDALMSRVAALRTRIAALTATLFSSKLRIELRSAGDSVRLKTLRVSLDGGVVYTAPAQTFFDQPQIVYEHAVAAGSHVIAVEVERQDAHQPQFSTWQSSRFVVSVPEKRQLWTRLELDGESSMGEDFAEDEAGRYELSVRLEVEVSE
jgi:hypothetical protein